MDQAEIENPDKSLVQRFIPRRKRWRFFLALVILFFIAFAIAWSQRNAIADNIIADQLEALGLPASYEVESVGGERQVIRDIVIGDPARPDLTVDRATVFLRYRLGTPAIGRVELEGARLFGTYRDGELSLGSLDPLLFAETGEPPSLPALDLRLIDARGLLETDFGPVGFKLEGEGEVDESFEGMLAAVAPDIEIGGCSVRLASLFGDISTRGGAPAFSGPVRMQQLSCPAADLVMEDTAIELTGSTDVAFDRFDGEARFSSGEMIYGGNRANGLGGRVEASWADGALNARYRMVGRGVALPQAQFALLTAEGSMRTRDDFQRSEVEAEIEGNGLRIGPALDEALTAGIGAAEGTLIAPLLRKARAGLRREQRESSLTALVSLRRTGDVTSIVIPSASLRGGSGATLASVSRLQYSTAGAGGARLSGNIATGGQGLPRINGRMERMSGGNAVFRLRMQRFRDGDSALEIPELVVTQARGGALGFTGNLVADGALPGGRTRNLRLPVSGTWSAGGGLALWQRCTEVGFGQLELASLSFTNRSVTLCPSPDGAILRSDARGLRWAAGSPGLDLAGQLASTPIRIVSGPVGFAYPGTMTARELDIRLGPEGTATRFEITDLTAALGEADIAGTFEDADVRLDAVPLDIFEANGDWRYAGNVLTLADASFRLEDRAGQDRFEPLLARGASLTLEDNIIDALATLRAPASDREVTDVAIRHNLSTGSGHADLTVDAIPFDEQLQPDQLSRLALGVIANTRGVVSGTGRIDWSQDGVTSTGAFSSDDLDFAAAFGPVRGASGTVRFSDLLGLTTEPGQTIRVASVNPGIEVLDGEVQFALTDGELLSVAGGSWPFMGGRLLLESTDLNLGISEERRYVFRITGLEAAQFVDQMELGNISATGTFDGVIPIVFDAQGNGRIEGGALDSRPPGGNVSYVGELTYEDLSAIANFAFDALRSLDYRRMTVRMDGPLTGEIVTRVRFDGVRQGEGTSNNFITRQIAALPLQFNVNIRAPFYQLITSVKSIYDPAFVRDPRELGLLSDDGDQLRRSITDEEVEDQVGPDDLTPEEGSVQTQESERMP